MTNSSKQFASRRDSWEWCWSVTSYTKKGFK